MGSGCEQWMFLLMFLLPRLVPVNPARGPPTQPEESDGCMGGNNQSYHCDTGYCCGDSKCCSYYYELWWFWLVWTIIIILSCCCVCHHRRAKLRLQQQQRQHEINLIAYQGARNYTLLPLYLRFLPSYLLPAYEEVVNRPVTPPPPYSTVHQQPVPSPDPEATRSPSQIHPALAESEGGSDYPVSVEGEELRGDTMDEKVQERPPTPPERRNLDMKELERSSTPPPPGRHRRFTGDSGIEVCVCNREGSKDEALDGLTDGGLEFCDSCCLCEQFPPEEGVSSPPEQQQHQHQHSHSTDPGHETPVSLLLGTIQENELQQTRHSDLYN